MLTDGETLEKQVFRCFAEKPKYLRALSIRVIRMMMLQSDKNSYSTMKEVPSDKRIRNVLDSWCIRGWCSKFATVGKWTYILTSDGCEYLNTKYKEMI